MRERRRMNSLKGVFVFQLVMLVCIISELYLSNIKAC